MPQKTDIVNLGPRRVARSRIVNVDATLLYDVLANPSRHHELDGSGSVGASVHGPASLATGDEFSIAMKLGPVRYQSRNTVTEAVPGKVFEWRLSGGHSWRWELESQADGSTRVTEVFDYREARKPWLVELAGFPRRNVVGIEATLAGLEANFGR